MRGGVALTAAGVTGAPLAGCTGDGADSVGSVTPSYADEIHPALTTELWTEYSVGEDERDAFVDRYTFRDSSEFIATEDDVANQWGPLPELDFGSTVAVLVVHGTCHPMKAEFATSGGGDLFLEFRPINLDNNYDCGEDPREVVLYEFALDDLGVDASTKVKFVAEEEEE